MFFKGRDIGSLSVYLYLPNTESLLWKWGENIGDIWNAVEINVPMTGISQNYSIIFEGILKISINPSFIWLIYMFFSIKVRLEVIKVTLQSMMYSYKKAHVIHLVYVHLKTMIIALGKMSLMVETILIGYYKAVKQVLRIPDPRN